MSEVDPIIGSWYRNQETGNDFEVVATDEDGQTIEIQYFDGELEELEIEAWYELPIELIEAPDDGSSLFEDIETDEDEDDYNEVDEDDEFSDQDNLLADRED